MEVSNVANKETLGALRKSVTVFKTVIFVSLVCVAEIL